MCYVCSLIDINGLVIESRRLVGGRRKGIRAERQRPLWATRGKCRSERYGEELAGWVGAHLRLKIVFYVKISNGCVTASLQEIKESQCLSDRR